MPSKKTRAITKLTATNKDLKNSVSTLRRRLTTTENKLARTEAKADRWKDEARALRTATSRADARMDKLQRRLDRATAALDPSHAPTTAEPATIQLPPTEPTGDDGLTVPDQTWTVAQLRAEARARGHHRAF